jgi:hypothetical protein
MDSLFRQSGLMRDKRERQLLLGGEGFALPALCLLPNAVMLFSVSIVNVVI